MDLLALIEKLEKEYPCVGDHETDARDTYPNRWQALKEAAKQNVHWTVAIESLEDSPWATGARNGKLVLPTRNSQ